MRICRDSRESRKCLDRVRYLIPGLFPMEENYHIIGTDFFFPLCSI